MAALLCAVSSVHPAPPAAADSIRDHQWALSAFDAEATEKLSSGRGVTVAVVDTGVDGTHPDLTGNVLPGKSFLAGGGRADRETDSVHGTAMASLIAGHGHGPGNSAGIKGLAPGAKILPLRVNVDGNLQFGSVKGVAEAIRYAAEHGASVINLSLASPSSARVLEESVRYARQKGAVVVAGAGNDGTDTPNYPASLPGVVSVGAVDVSGKIWAKSNYGSNTLVAAPGVDNYSAGLNHQYQTESGTSDATAYVSAAAALLRAKFPHLTAGQIANRLVKTAKLPDSVAGGKLPDKHYGYGFIRPYRALAEDIPAGARNGPLPGSAPSASPEDAGSAAGPGQETTTVKDGSVFVVRGVVGAAGIGLLGALAVGVIRRRRPVVPPPPVSGRQPPGPDFRQ
ncbi:S8 family serine peptidase [Streptomyces kronopolitis]|uniref:S8 family serine peptidase n=1 Tax=Streptomyces kronopolitis TaxID=1612435 RepID=UPI0020BFE2BB|nr:S8 family serine peptidase [Streptomyces kronopolitis]MCL6296932.1 S8 family serine peptidase [Streptomyces kronopolitis]